MVDFIRKDGGLRQGALHSSQALASNEPEDIPARDSLLRNRTSLYGQVDLGADLRHPPHNIARARSDASVNGMGLAQTAPSALDSARARASAMRGRSPLATDGSVSGRMNASIAGSSAQGAGGMDDNVTLASKQSRLSVMHVGVSKGKGAVSNSIRQSILQMKAQTSPSSAPDLPTHDMNVIEEGSEGVTSGTETKQPHSPPTAGSSTTAASGKEVRSKNPTTAGLNNQLSPLYESSRHTEVAVLRSPTQSGTGVRGDEEVVTPEQHAHLMQRFASKHGLSIIQEKRGRQLESRLGTLNPDLIFPDTELMGMNDAQKIYLCLPFMSNPPVPKCIFSTLAGSPRSLGELYSAGAKVNAPVVIVVKAGFYTFGAYLSAPLALNGVWAGSPSSFLFSLTLDMRIPYHGERVPNLNKPDPSHTYGFFADVDQLVIGNGDLVFSSDLMRASSELEGCFGVGMGVGSADARHALAGAPAFVIDEIEVWAIL